jgi:hypothetical protein
MSALAASTDDLIVSRKRAELHAKTTSLRSEMKHWCDLSEDPKKPFTKHYTQVRRITARIEGLLADTDTRLARADLLAQAQAIQDGLLKAHSLWDFFRSKLVLRADPFLSDYLRVCDEFAWACYKPLQIAYTKTQAKAGGPDLVTRIKEPPLTFLNGIRSPFAAAREALFRLDFPNAVPGSSAPVIEKLPVPMIGLPWYQAAHLPDALAIAHETGHIAEWDFQLTAAITEAVAAAGTAYGEAWASWQTEVFADVYGCLAAGPSFARSLADFLPAEVADVQGPQPRADAWGKYPPPSLRVMLSIEAISRDFREDAEQIKAEWRNKYGDQVSAEWHADVPKIVSKLLAGPYPTLGGGPLDGVIYFPKTANGKPMDLAVSSDIQRGFALSDTNPRVLLAAARRLYDQSPDAFVTTNTGAKVNALVLANQEGGTRGARELAADIIERERAAWRELL